MKTPNVLWPGMDVRLIGIEGATKFTAQRVCRVEACLLGDVNGDDPINELVTVYFSRPVIAGIERYGWQYYREDGRDFWNNPTVPTLTFHGENDMGVMDNGGQNKPANDLYRALSTVFLINSAAFDGIKIGCQTIPRVDVEAIARHYGWEPVTSSGG